MLKQFVHGVPDRAEPTLVGSGNPARARHQNRTRNGGQPRELGERNLLRIGFVGDELVNAGRHAEADRKLLVAHLHHRKNRTYLLGEAADDTPTATPNRTAPNRRTSKRMIALLGWAR